VLDLTTTFNPTYVLCPALENDNVILLTGVYGFQTTNRRGGGFHYTAAVVEGFDLLERARGCEAQ
jgi:hypothetical protein